MKYDDILKNLMTKYRVMEGLSYQKTLEALYKRGMTVEEGRDLLNAWKDDAHERPGM